MNNLMDGDEKAAQLWIELPSVQKKRKKRSANFSEEEKHQLAREVKMWPAMWDITSTHHSNKNAVDQAWRTIAGILGKSESECKSAWTAMRESYRYHAKVARKNKSGSAGGQTLEEPAFDDSVDWEFGEDLSFLPSTSKKRKTFTTPISETDEVASPRSNRCSDYSYVTWLKVDRGKFFEFINGRNPPFRNSTVEGGEIDWERSNETQVTLRYVDFNATGQYYCEVSTDTPIFTKASGDEIMNVFLPQPGPPIIKFRKRTPFSIGERLFALCNTTRARPAPTITWLINGKKVDPQFVRTHHMRSNRSHHRFQQQQQQQQQRQEYYQQYLHQYPQQYRVPYLIDRYDKSLRWSGSRADDDFSLHTVHHHDGHHHSASVLNNPFSSLANMHDVHEIQHRSYENKNKHIDMKKHIELKKHMELMKHRI